MAEPVKIEIRLRAGQWMITRDGQDLAPYSHADDAIHAAAQLGRDLIHTGQPATVQVQLGEQMITVDLTEPRRVATPGEGEDERSAVVPDRSPSA